MVRCPFHDDHTPSLKLNKDYFYCFGCETGGDVVTFAANLFHLRPYEAASKLAADFGVDVPATAPPDGSLNHFREDLSHCRHVLEEYWSLLARWHRQYAPMNPDAELDDRYVEACQMLEPIDYLLDVLANGTLAQCVRTADRLMENGTLDQLEERLHRLTREETASKENEER